MYDLRRTIRHILLGTLAPYSLSSYAAPPVAPAPGQLPIPCQAGLCGTNNSFITSGNASAVIAGKSLTVNQTSSTATLNWSSFNIGSGGKVTFVQPSSSAVALNRIYSANPSQIFGNLTANGQIYLINANGFLFGATSTVNVNGLIASSLNITDSTFTNGILSPLSRGAPALEPFTGNYQHFADDGPAGSAPLPNTGSITVSSGAQLSAVGGRLLLAAGSVDNGGALSAPDGQVILAGGQSVYLQASQNNSLRGLIVQVDAGSSAANLLSSVVNESSGSVSAPRGNVTLASLMINQDGRLSATTSVSANGSVTLTAGTAPVTNTSNVTPIAASRGGQITVGPASDIEILPELTDTATAVDLQAQLPSTVTISGQKIYLQGGTIHAPGGTLAVTASSNPSSGVGGGSDPAASLRIDAGASIDLSGSDATLPMDANLIQVQLRSNEFADDPTQRNGDLRGDTVTVDIRADNGQGSPIADLASAIAAVGKNIGQRTEAGGTADFISGGDIVFAPGASVNVSGGATTYIGGTIQTTKLVGANGQITDIGSANPLQTYTGVINPSFTQVYNNFGVKQVVPTPGMGTYQQGYVQGATAGTVQFAAPSMVLQGGLTANSVAGPYQRAASGSGLLGGTLIVGTLANTGSLVSNLIGPAIEVMAAPSPIVVADGASLPPVTLQLPATYLTADGFNHIQLDSNTSFLLPQGLPLQLGPGTSLQVQAARIDVDSSIASLGGSLIFQSEQTLAEPSFANLNSPAGTRRLGIDLGDGVTLDVSGRWSNDDYVAGGAGSAPTLQNGGTIELQLADPARPGELVLGNNVSLRANGGAWLQGSGTMSYGAGGSITLDDSPEPGGALQFGANTAISAFGVGTALGGSFVLDAPRIAMQPGTGSWTQAQRVDDLTAPGGVVQLYSPLLSNDGFSNITLNATAPAVPGTVSNVVSVEPGSYVLQTRSLQLSASAPSHPTGGTVLDFSQTALLPAYERPAANLSLGALRLVDDALLNAANYGNIDFEAGAAIIADPHASVSIAGAGDIFFGGSVLAPAGSFSLKLLSPADLGVPNVTQVDPGYVPGLGITVAAQAHIDVSAGAVPYTPSVQGLLLGSLSNGGSVSINADRGSVRIAAGAQIDFSGTSAPLDVFDPTSGRYVREAVASAAGSVKIGAADSIELLGVLHGAGGVGSAGAAAGGSLEVDLAGLPGDVFTDPLVPPNQPRLLNLVADATGLPPSSSEQANLGVAQILTGTGIDALTLNAGGTGSGEIRIATTEPLSLARSLTLQAQTLGVANGVAASANAPDVLIGNSIDLSVSGTSQQLPVPGTGTLAVSSQLLTLIGNVTVDGTKQLTLSSQGDIQLQGTVPVQQSGPEQGSLTAPGHITLQAQRVYPDTFTSFTITAENGTGPTTVNIDSAVGQAASSSPPLSAGGALNVTADRIEVGGSIFAPFGSISLNANQALQLSSGSLLSVSGAGLDIPYGETLADGGQWVYRDPLPSSSGLSGAGSTVAGSGIFTSIGGAPAKAVNLTAPDIAVQPNASVNLTGGGDLYAYEWVPGTGGTADRLAGSGNPANIPGLYAILPAQPGIAAPHDPEEGGAFGSTQTIYLSGGAGISAGYYALLPPRYGLLPGALLIQAEPSYTSPAGGQIGALANGVPVIGGFFSSFGTTVPLGSTLFQGFAVYPAGYGQQLATYTINQASSYFANTAQNGGGFVPVPADAGTLNLAVITSATAAIGTALSLHGNVATAAAPSGHGATINLSAPDLELSPDGTASVSGDLPVSAAVLQSWNAGEITLGGSTSASGSSAIVAADHVVVDSGVSLSADQIFLMAHDGIEVQAGASLASTSGAAGHALAAAPGPQALSLSDSGAAFLGVSDLELPLIVRSGAAGTGALTLDPGSRVSSGGALTFDAPGSLLAAGTLSGNGASWVLASDSIAFVGSTGAHPDTLNINAGLQQSLESAGSLRLASQGDIDLLVPVSLGVNAGNSSLSALTLIGMTIDNQTGASSTFGGASLSLGGASSTPGNSTVGSGTLTLVGNNLNLLSNPIGFSGFGDTVIRLAGALTSSAGAVSGISTAGDLTVNAAELTPGAGSQTALTATGMVRVDAAIASTGAIAPLVGGALALQGGSVDVEGTIAAPAGVVTLTATSGDVHLGSGATINVAGTLLQAADQSAPAPGGTISLAASGRVTLDAGSMLSVSGEQVAPAGRLNIYAGGVATLDGALAGHAGSGGTGGDFTLNAGQLAGGFTPLTSNLMAGGFSDSVDVRVHQGDLTLAGDSSLTSNNIVLTADNGSVDIGGVLTAPSAALRGHIDLSGQSVLLESGAGLHADGVGGHGLGGEIELNAACSGCSITLNPGSVISASGAAGMGEVALRAAAGPGPNPTDVAINSPGTGISGLGADLTQAGQVIIEPVLSFSTNSATVASDLPGDVQTASDFLTSNTQGITQRLSGPSVSQLGSTPLLVEAGIELTDSDSVHVLTLPGIDLSPYSLSPSAGGLGQVINVGVRAAGSVAVNGTLSDGFVTDPNSFLLALSATPSAGFSIVAGADLGSTNPLATVRGAAASLTLLSSPQNNDDTQDGIGPAVIRTGTGDINLAAAGNIVFDVGTGRTAYSGSVYTGGLAPANVVGPAYYFNTNILMNFGAGGGDVRLAAGGNIVGAPVGVADPAVDGGNFGVTGWLFHQGSADLPAQYGVDYGAFDWNVGALGGGDVRVFAGGNINNLSAAAADSYVSADNTANGQATQYGAGGGLVIHAGGDIGTPQIYVADGVGTLTADGALAASRLYKLVTQPKPVALGAAIALGDSQISAWVRNGLQVDAIYDPTLVPQVGGDLEFLTTTGFLSYGPKSGVSLSTTSGSAVLEVSSSPNNSPLGGLVGSFTSAGTFSVMAPNLNLQALQGDVNLTGSSRAVLAPAADGQLTLFAARNLTATTNTTIVMADTQLSTLPTVANPGLLLALNPFSGVVHAQDTTPALVTAGEDILGLALQVPKAAQIVAGRDIVNLSFQGQNTSSDDVTLISAGRDYQNASASGSGVVVGGPGSVDLFTGRNLDLGFGQGVVTVGNLRNANLPYSVGADINMMVGYGSEGADVSGFLTAVVFPSAAYQDQLVSFVESLNGASGLTFTQARAEFLGLSNPQQSAFVDAVFFHELLLSGRAANAGSSTGFAQGYAAIDALYPGSRSTQAGGGSSASTGAPYSGDLTLSSSQIYTDDGGSISILAPGGRIDVGLANAPPGVPVKSASQLGIVAEGAGNIDIYALNDVNVNTSRIFTLGGGNILIWSTLGSIDAGNGSKSSLSVPPPTISINTSGQVSLSFGASLAAGSGIRTIQTDSDVPPGDVDLDAPVGTVNAGDAGIGASGNINIAAAHVVGVDNINFGGTATGVPSDVSSLGASLSGASAAAAGTSNSSTGSAQENANNGAKQTAPIAAAALSWLDVFVTGLGEENCKQDDIECLKRQKTAAP